MPTAAPKQMRLEGRELSAENSASHAHDLPKIPHCLYGFGSIAPCYVTIGLPFTAGLKVGFFIRRRLSAPASGLFASRLPPETGSPSSLILVVGGVDGTRTRGLRRDRQEAMTAQRSRPRKNGFGCPPPWPLDAARGRVFQNGLQILAIQTASATPSITVDRRRPYRVDCARPRSSEDWRGGLFTFIALDTNYRQDSR